MKRSIGIGGVAKEPHEAVVPGATVTLVWHEKATSLPTISDQPGLCRFEHLSSAFHLLLATAKERGSFAVRIIDTIVGAQANADLQLHLAAVTESVTVTASVTAQTV